MAALCEDGVWQVRSRTEPVEGNTLGLRFPDFFMILFYSSGVADPYSILIYTWTDRLLVVPYLNDMGKLSHVFNS